MSKPSKSNKTGHSLEARYLEIVSLNDASDKEKLCHDIITKNTGKPLEFIKEARVYGVWVRGITDKTLLREKAKEIAIKVGKSINHVWNSLSLLEATPDVLKMIEKHQVSATLAIDLYILAGPTKGDWAKVQEAIIEALAKALSAGNPKASMKYVPDDKRPNGK